VAPIRCRCDERFVCWNRWTRDSASRIFGQSIRLSASMAEDAENQHQQCCVEGAIPYLHPSHLFCCTESTERKSRILAWVGIHGAERNRSSNRGCHKAGGDETDSSAAEEGPSSAAVRIEAKRRLFGNRSKESEGRGERANPKLRIPRYLRNPPPYTNNDRSTAYITYDTIHLLCFIFYKLSAIVLA
jgi:hypothetical protein